MTKSLIPNSTGQAELTRVLLEVQRQLQALQKGQLGSGAVTDLVAQALKRLGPSQVITYVAPKGRKHVAAVTPDLGFYQTAYLEVEFTESCDMISVASDHEAWIRVYSTAAARLEDATRPYVKDPIPGHGIMGEVATYGPDYLQIDFSPVPFFNNQDETLGKTAYIAVTLMENGYTGPVNLDFMVLPQEQVSPSGPMGPTGLRGPVGPPGAASTVPGPQGPQGIQGQAGAAGADGKSIRYGTTDPGPTDGVDGEFWINTTSHYLFGPKAAGAWPEGTSLVGPAGSGGGNGVIGMAYAQTSAYSGVTAQIPVDDTIPQSNEGYQLLTVNYTPKSATSTLILEACLVGSLSATQNASVAIFQDSDVNAIAAGTESWVTGNYTYSVRTSVHVPSGSTTSRIYKMRVGPAGGTLYVNGSSATRRLGGVNYSYIRVTEIEN